MGTGSEVVKEEGQAAGLEAGLEYRMFVPSCWPTLLAHYPAVDPVEAATSSHSHVVEADLSLFEEEVVAEAFASAMEVVEECSLLGLLPPRHVAVLAGT